MPTTFTLRNHLYHPSVRLAVIDAAKFCQLLCARPNADALREFLLSEGHDAISVDGAVHDILMDYKEFGKYIEPNLKNYGHAQTSNESVSQKQNPR